MAQYSNLRIVFMGTPDFAVATLSKLVESGYEMACVITAPDRPAGRGRKLHQSAVKKYALENGLKVLQPINLKDIEFLKELRLVKANLQIVVAFRMLPKVVWEMTEYGTFNLHASLLPDYRGAAPINWAIINGETKTGVTTFFIDEKIDTGEIIFQKEIVIAHDDTAGSLHDRLMTLGAALVLKTVKEVENKSVDTKKQPYGEDLKLAHKIHKKTCEVNWHASIDHIYNHIRGLSPFPTAWTTLENANEKIFLKIYSASKEIENHEHRNGQIIFNKKEMKVAVKGGFINLLEIQLPGKRKMATNDVLNGLNLSNLAYMS